MLLTVLCTNVIHTSDDTVRLSLCIISLSHTENEGRAPSILNWAVWTWWFPSHTLYLFAKRLAEAQKQSEASDVQSTAGRTLYKLFWLRENRSSVG